MSRSWYLEGFGGDRVRTETGKRDWIVSVGPKGPPR